MRILRTFVTLLVLASLAFGAVQLYQLIMEEPERDETPPVSFQEAPPIPPLEITFAHPDFFYQEDALVYRDAVAGANRPVARKTTLTSPRDLFPSPDGTKIAYWLDNIHDPEKALTELWLFDRVDLTSKLLAERIHRPDVLTQPRWNSAGSHLFFIADNGPERESKVELVVVGIQPAEAKARFTEIDWLPLLDNAALDLIDIDGTGRALAFVDQPRSKTSRLNVITESTPLQRTSASQGEISYLQWLENGSLLYTVADGQGFSFWRLRGGVHTFVARRESDFQAARADIGGQYVAFIEGRDIYALDLGSGRVERQSASLTGDDIVAMLHVAPAAAGFSRSAVAGIFTHLEDAELTAFVENNLAHIAGESQAFPVRLLTTQLANVVYVDYRTNGETKRLLITVRDAVHPEWSIRARYEPAGGEWRKVQGGSLPDPEPVRLYEWESSLNQWILKSDSR